MSEKKDGLVLSIETATRSGSLAVLRGETVCGEWRGDESFSHSGELLVVIQEVLNKAKINLNEINVFAAAVGPGSFTGLRVGIATVKGLTAALRKTAFGVPTLEAVAFGFEKPVCSILPAGRAEVFAQVFASEANAQLQKIQLSQLNDVLLELHNLSDVSIVAPLENHSEIQSFIDKENKTDWKIFAPPENLAISVGKATLQRRMLGNDEHGNLQIIYGREAVVGRKRRHQIEMADLEIKQMTAEHLEDVLRIAEQCGLGVWSKLDYENELLNETALLFVALNNQTITGFISARLITPTVEILNIGVLPEFRRQGTGEKLLETVLQQAKSGGATESWLEVRAGNRGAQNFYLAKNFKVVGVRRNYYSNPLEDAVLMTSIFSGATSEKMNIELDANKILS